MIRLSAERLQPLLTDQLKSIGLEAPSVEHVARSLVQTSLRGVDSHGLNLFPHYHRAVLGGRINRSPRIREVRKQGGTALLDADHAFGHHAGATAIDLAQELAAEHGIAAVGVRNSTHFGAAAYFALRASANGYAAFAFTNADALAKVHGSNRAFLGTNPLCFTAPLADEEPLCLDMATTQVSWNKIMQKRKAGGQIPSDWGFTKEGQPTDDPNAVASLAPIGTYKGYGLAIMVECLCGILCGGPIGIDIPPMFTSPIALQRHISHFFMAIDIRRFADLEAFKKRLQEMVGALRGLPGMDGPVMVPGDPEKRTYSERIRTGIPMEPERFEEFLKMSPTFSEAVLP